MPTKTLPIMNFAVVLLLVVCLQAGVSGFSQRVTLSEKSETLIRVFQKIKKQTGYGFFFDESWLQLSARVTIRVKEAPIYLKWGCTAMETLYQPGSPSTFCTVICALRNGLRLRTPALGFS